MPFARNFAWEKKKKKIWERGRGKCAILLSALSVKRKIPPSPSEPWVFRGGERKEERGGWLKLSFLLALYLRSATKKKREEEEEGWRQQSAISFVIPPSFEIPPPPSSAFSYFFLLPGKCMYVRQKKGRGRKKEKRTKLPAKEEDEFANLEIFHTLKLGEAGTGNITIPQLQALNIYVLKTGK